MPSKYGFGDERKKDAPTYMKKSAFKMKGFSGFGNSPAKQDPASLSNPETLGQIEDISGMLGSFGGGGDEEKKSVTPISVAMIPTPDVKGAR